jgi:hypothetical protein
MVLAPEVLRQARLVPIRVSCDPCMKWVEGGEDLTVRKVARRNPPARSGDPQHHEEELAAGPATAPATRRDLAPDGEAEIDGLRVFA